MKIQCETIEALWRILSLGLLPKYKIDIYSATDSDIEEVKKWLKSQGMPYTSNKFAYFSADDIDEAEKYKPKITIRIRTEENLIAFKLAWM